MAVETGRMQLLRDFFITSEADDIFGLSITTKI